jgi:predicted kinase
LFATVGANGSGKSNFFHGNFNHVALLYYHLSALMREYSPDLFILNAPAIRFVLSDMFQNLRSEDRGALLHVYSLFV